MNTHRPLQPHIKSREAKLLNASFNQDQTCFAICTESGFQVFTTDPMELRMERNFSKMTPNISSINFPNVDTAINSSSLSSPSHSASNTGIGIIKMLYRTNYVALVGGGKYPRFSLNKLCIWDDLKKKCSIILEFNTPILDIHLSRTHIVVVLQNQVLVYSFKLHPDLISSYETYNNPYGTADLTVTENFSILAFPGRNPGQIQLVDISPAKQDKKLISIIKAHKGNVRSICLSNAGHLVASASETGTLVRVHDTKNCILMFEFRRGVDRAIISSMKFSPDDSKLAVLSDKNTLHVFNLYGKDKDEENKVHFLRGVPLVPSYFKSTWSFVSKNVGNKDDTSNDYGVLGWSDNESIVILWKFKGIWEKYDIVESQPDNASDLNSTGSGGKSASFGPLDTINNRPRWEIMREGWRSFN